MAITKDTVIDQIEITETGTVQVRYATYAVEDGVRIGNLGYSRTSYDPTPVNEVDHPRRIDTAEPEVKAVAALAFTADRIQAAAARSIQG